MYTSNNLTANQSAIASKLGSYSLIRGHQGNTHRLSGRHREKARLPQFDPGTSGKYSSAVRAPSRAGSLLQFDPGTSGRYGLAVRAPSRAGSLLQFDPGASGRYGLAVRPLSRASPLPQGIGGIRRIRLADRPRSPSRRTIAQTQKRHPKVPFLFSTDYRSSDQPASTAC